MEHRPSTTPRLRTLFWAALVIPDQLVPCCFSSASVSRLQLLRGRRLFLFPCGFQVRAWRVVLDAGFLRVCPIQPHFLPIIRLATGSCPARSHRSLPQYPFQKVGVVLCEKKGGNYLAAIDYYSRYTELAKLSITTSAAVIQELKEIFARQGIPEVLVSDNGSQFSSKEFKDFTVTWGITHVTSSPKFPQSIGEAESCADCETDAGSARCFSRSSVLQINSKPFPWSQSC